MPQKAVFDQNSGVNPQYQESDSVGRRKKAIARVRLILGNGNILINKRSIDDYFCHATLKFVVR